MCPRRGVREGTDVEELLVCMWQVRMTSHAKLRDVINRTFLVHFE